MTMVGVWGGNRHRWVERDLFSALHGNHNVIVYCSITSKTLGAIYGKNDTKRATKKFKIVFFFYLALK